MIIIVKILKMNNLVIPTADLVLDDDVSDEGEAVLGGGRAAIFEATERSRDQNDHFMGVKGTKKNDQKPTSIYRGGVGPNVKVSGQGEIIEL